MKVKLSKGEIALVDKQDYQRVIGLPWYKDKEGYARNSSNEYVLMHRFILKPPKGMYTDHINHNRLDNRRSNLRICKPAENAWNRTHKPRGSSKYRGVCWDKSRNKWRATIVVNKKYITIGRFKTEKEALLAREAMVSKHHGQYQISQR